MARHLRKLGYATHTVSYKSTKLPIEECGKVVAEKAMTLDRPHLVGHSLGGLVVLQALKHLDYTGRAVLLGSPLKGSRIARRLAGLPGGKWMLGVAGESLEYPVPRPPDGWEVGMIAGSVRVGMGALLGGSRFAGDGTVGDEESQAEWLTDRVVVGQSHSSLQLVGTVARVITTFFESGCFEQNRCDS